MTKSAGPVLQDLYRKFGDQVAFVSLYVREAHPGNRYPQPHTFAEKMAHARAYQERDQLPWPVAVDDIDGDLHRALGGNPNAAYIMDPSGLVLYRVLWSNDWQALEKGLEPLVHQVAQRVSWTNDAPVFHDGLETITYRYPFPIGQSEPHLIPLLTGMGAMYPTLKAAGGTAQHDFQQALPPVYALARLAALFQPLPYLARSIAALATVGIAGSVVLVGGALALIRAQRTDP